MTQGSVKAEKGQLQIRHGVDRAVHDQLVRDDKRYVSCHTQLAAGEASCSARPEIFAV
jgi:hypothetical protein